MANCTMLRNADAIVIFPIPQRLNHVCKNNNEYVKSPLFRGVKVPPFRGVKVPLFRGVKSTVPGRPSLRTRARTHIALQNDTYGHTSQEMRYKPPSVQQGHARTHSTHARGAHIHTHTCTRTHTHTYTHIWDVICAKINSIFAGT